MTRTWTSTIAVALIVVLAATLVFATGSARAERIEPTLQTPPEASAMTMATSDRPSGANPLAGALESWLHQPALNPKGLSKLHCLLNPHFCAYFLVQVSGICLLDDDWFKCMQFLF